MPRSPVSGCRAAAASTLSSRGMVRGSAALLAFALVCGPAPLHSDGFPPPASDVDPREIGSQGTDGAVPSWVEPGKAGPLGCAGFQVARAAVVEQRAGASLAGPAPAASEGIAAVRVRPDPRGRVTLPGALDRHAVTFVLDPDLDVLVLGGAEAERLGIDYRSGPVVVVQRPTGRVFGHRVTLRRVRLAGFERFDVQAVVLPGDSSRMVTFGPGALDGVEMRFDNGVLVIEARR